MDMNHPEDALRKLQSLQKKHEVSIIKLAEPISAGKSANHGSNQRNSDASETTLDTVSAASLEADLTHYKELFAKLRFSYVEQVTKEKFIRAIVGDPPLIVTPQENADLEKENAAAKAKLKALKVEVADMVAELERRGRDLTQRYEAIKMETAQLEDLPSKIAGLEESIAELKAGQALGDNPHLALPLSRTLDLVKERKAQQAQLDRELEYLNAQLPRKQKEMERLQAELAPLETKRQNSTTAAKEARRRKEAALGGVQDELEERGRWWRAQETALNQMLDLKDQ